MKRHDLTKLILALDALALQASHWTAEARQAKTLDGAVAAISLIEPIGEDLMALARNIVAMHAAGQFKSEVRS
ncbi:MAG: hypothetical protein GC150_07465 [Rhizobiales bacterium]|nr:hypothetical protein [Hyphomicrobiales bacterium]